MNRTNRRRGKFIQRIRKWNNGMRYRWLWKNTTRRLIEIGIDPNSSHSRKESGIHSHTPTIRNKSHYLRTASIQETEKKYTTLFFLFGKNLKETKKKTVKRVARGGDDSTGGDALAAQFNTPVIIETLRQSFISFFVIFLILRSVREMTVFIGKNITLMAVVGRSRSRQGEPILTEPRRLAYR